MISDSQVVSIVDQDQLQQTTEQNYPTQLETEPETERRWRCKFKCPQLEKNHVTSMMVICLAVSCFITVFSLLMIIMPCLSELSKFQKMTTSQLDWSDRSIYKTVVQPEDKYRFKRSTQDSINQIYKDLERFKRDEICYEKIKDLSSNLFRLLDDPSSNLKKIILSHEDIKVLFDVCKKRLQEFKKKSADSEGYSQSEKEEESKESRKNVRELKNDLHLKINMKHRSDRENEKNQKIKRVRMSGDFPPTGPDDMSPGEIIKTSQQVTVTLPQVMQQTCVLKTPQQLVPHAPPTYVCYPSNTGKKDANDQQSIHVPTAISSPNPYYFPTVAGSPIITPSQHKPAFNPFTGSIQLSPNAPQIPNTQFQQAPILHHQIPQYQLQQNPVHQSPVIQLQMNPYMQHQPIYQPISLHPGSQIQIQCNYHPAPGSPYKVFSFPSVAGVSESTRSSVRTEHNATNYRPLEKFAGAGNCNLNEVNCGDDDKTCIPITSICDSKVDCPNARDEISCSCKHRIPNQKHCDGFPDCPGSEDEIHCHDCGPGGFSCDGAANAKATCIPLAARCDGIPQCPNGKDEIDCILLGDDLQNHKKSFVSYNQGYLHKNIHGTWYPVCVEKGSVDLARQACMNEQGYYHYRMPLVGYPKKPDDYDGPFIAFAGMSKSLLLNCYGNKAVYVRCPTITCGRQHHHGHSELINRRHREIIDKDSATKTLTQNQHYRNSTQPRKQRNQENRVVGGWKSEPGRWPWVVAIYKDGKFHCGGVIIDTRNILTAAHCFITYENHYFEVYAGMLKRLSYSPNIQLRGVDQVFIHHDYNTKSMQNDLCILKLDRELKLNRWVGVVCIPPAEAEFPKAGDTCTAVGWGATYEHGPDPDHMHEVEVPIMTSCKHREDREAEEICAGAIEGGRDTCQGDSGGPLLCRDQTQTSPEWYVSGIVSHGEGCARPDEPGAYTRVSLYRAWIIEVLTGKIDGGHPKKNCPGMHCYDGRCIDKDDICDGFVDCLKAEDEIDCRRNKLDSDEQLPNYPVLTPLLRESNVSESNGNEDNTQQDVIKNNVNGTVITSDLNPTDHSQIKKSNETTLNKINSSIIKVSTEEKSSTADVTIPKQSTLSPSKIPLILNVSTDEHPNHNTAAKFKEAAQDNPKMKLSSHRNHSADTEIATLSCNNFNQLIKDSYRCDGYSDCEDGSDEINCTCRDRLQHLNPALICDSKLDCWDKTDEDHCQKRCKEDQVFLPGSKTCINQSIRCNYTEEFPNEDEDGCYYLVPNVTAVEYKNGMIAPSTRGLLMRQPPGTTRPSPVCSSFKNFNILHQNVIKFLGFGAWEWFAPVQFPGIQPDNCTGVYGVAQNYPRFNRKAPWLASVAIEGNVVTSAVLIDPSWLLTSLQLKLLDATKINSTYLSCRLGFLSVTKGKGVGPKGIYEEVKEIDKAVVVVNHGLVLLKLKTPVMSSPKVKPLILLDGVERKAVDKCYLVGLEISSKIHVGQATRIDCGAKRVCYNVDLIKDNSDDKEDPSNRNTRETTSRIWSGGIWCQDEKEKPYLDCIFDNRLICEGPCTMTCNSVYNHYSLLSNLTDTYESETSSRTEDLMEQFGSFIEQYNIKNRTRKQLVYHDYEYEAIEEQTHHINYDSSRDNYNGFAGAKLNGYESGMGMSPNEYDQGYMGNYPDDVYREGMGGVIYNQGIPDMYDKQYNENQRFKRGLKGTGSSKYPNNPNGKHHTEEITEESFEEHVQHRQSESDDEDFWGDISDESDLHGKNANSDVQDRNYSHEYYKEKIKDEVISQVLEQMKMSKKEQQARMQSSESHDNSEKFFQIFKDKLRHEVQNYENELRDKIKNFEKLELELQNKKNSENQDIWDNISNKYNSEVERIPQIYAKAIGLNKKIANISDKNPKTNFFDRRRDVADYTTNIRMHSGIIVLDIDVGKGAECDGVRCTDGKCIHWNKIQDGFTDCLDGKDEDPSLEKKGICSKHPEKCIGCKRDEISCGDGTCIPSSKFCDGTFDCSTKMDEPKDCSTNCSSYLALKHPTWLCDGNPHCYDTSDETWQTCGSHSACNRPEAFTCESSSGCIHNYQVCDGIKDCPQGEDERVCIALKSKPDKLNEGLVVTRILGTWLPLCLNSTLIKSELHSICHSLGRNSFKEIQYINTTAQIPTLEPYSTVILNSRVQYAMIRERSAFKLQLNDHCLSLHITCH